MNCSLSCDVNEVSRSSDTDDQLKQLTKLQQLSQSDLHLSVIRYKINDH